MKKRLVVAVLMGSILTGCGNKQVFDTKQTFTKATISLGNKTIEVEIDKWKGYEDTSIQIIAKDGTVYLTDLKNVILEGK